MFQKLIKIVRHVLETSSDQHVKSVTGIDRSGHEIFIEMNDIKRDMSEKGIKVKYVIPIKIFERFMKSIGYFVFYSIYGNPFLASSNKIKVNLRIDKREGKFGIFLMSIFFILNVTGIIYLINVLNANNFPLIDFIVIYSIVAFYISAMILVKIIAEMTRKGISSLRSKDDEETDFLSIIIFFLATWLSLSELVLNWIPRKWFYPSDEKMKDALFPKRVSQGAYPDEEGRVPVCIPDPYGRSMKSYLESFDNCGIALAHDSFKVDLNANYKLHRLKPSTKHPKQGSIIFTTQGNYVLILDCPEKLPEYMEKIEKEFQI